MEHQSHFPTTSEQSMIPLVQDINPTCNSINPNLTIIFFHNIALGNFKETWTSQSQVCWPEKWLPEDLGENIRILSVSCHATSPYDLMEIGKNILQSLVLSYENLWDAPIALVGYSFGGLMLKSLVVEVTKRMYERVRNSLDEISRGGCKKFLENVKGMAFYSVPHGGGSQIFSSFFASQCLQTNVIGKKFEHDSKSLNLFNLQMEQLDVDFTHSIKENDCNVFAFSEGLPINRKQGIIVPYASSIRLSSQNNYKIEDVNHLTICRPPTKEHPSYFLLLRMLRTCLEKSTLLPVLPTFEVDLTSHVKNVIKLLEKVPIIGLVGMAGIGKTTLSKKIYHLIHNQYEKSSFLENVGSKDVEDVLKQLLRDLCGKKLHKHEYVGEDDFQLIRQCLITKKALVVIDDVRAEKDLVALQVFIVISKIESKSKVIVNCRNWGILKAHVSKDGKVDMPLLNDVQARELFMFHAFGGASYVPKSFEEISNKVVAACDGLPLSLEVLGTFLKQNHNMEIWEDTLKGFHKMSSTFQTSEDRLNKALRIMYEGLTRKEKDMFLDIACFFCDDFFVEKGLRITTAEQIWDRLGLLNLQHKSLINITKNGIIIMHRQLRNLGRQIAWDEKRNRSWDPQETLRLFSHQNEVDINFLEGMSLLGCEEVPSLLHKNNMKFPNLRLLDMRKTSSNVVRNCIRKKRFNKLKWISLQASNIQKLPNDLVNYSNLHVLDLAGCQYLEQLPNFVGSKLVQLQEFDLSGCSKLENLPDAIGGMVNLQHLLMKDCVKLQKLPTSIGQLNNLRKFDLSGCLNVQELPTSIGSLSALCELDLSKCSKFQELLPSISQLHVLKYLNISWCKGLHELPSTIGNLHALQKFDLSNCFKIQKLPTSIGQLSNLQDFNLSRCSALHELPISIGELITLQKFDLSDCSNLLELPTSIGELNALKEFNLSRCSKLQELPSSIGKLINLQELNLSMCFKLENLPNGIGGMLSLQHLLVKDCVKLQKLPTSIGQMSNIYKFDLSGCSNVQKLPTSISSLNALRELNLSKCEGLQELPKTIGDLHDLQKLDLSNCFKIQELPTSIGKLINLQDFNLSKCFALHELPISIGELISLQKFDLSECSNLFELPTSIGALSALQKLNLSGCSKLQELPTSIGELITLQELNLLRCSQLQSLPTSIKHLIALQKFDVSGCVELQELPKSIGLLSDLQELNLLGCSKLQGLPISICQLDSLKELNLSYCSTLCELPNDPMGKLNALQCLDLFGCFGLQKLPDVTIAQLNMLQELDMYGCFGLQELPESIDKLIVLKKLNLHGCIRLQNLPTSIGQLCALQIFNLSNCIELKELPTSIGRLHLLQEFDLSRCFKLVDLPISICELKSLQIFNLSECYMLKELPSSIGKLTNLEKFDLSKCYGLKELPSSIAELFNSGKFNLVGWSNWQDKMSRRRQETQHMLGTMIQSIQDPPNRSPTTLQSLFPERKGMKKIVFMGKKATKGDSRVEFLYPDAKDMAMVVGIGIKMAKVVVTNHFDVEVREVEDENIWTNLWNSKIFVPMAIFLPNSPTERERNAQSNLILENPSRSSGVGLIGNDGIVHVEGNNTLQGDQRISPLIWDLAEHMGLIRENFMLTTEGNFQAGSTGGSIDDGRSPGDELQRRRSLGTFKNFMQPRKICIKDYDSSEENEGDTTFLVNDPLDSPPSSSSLGAKVSKNMVGIGRQSTRINIGETSGLSQDEKKVGEDDCKPFVLTSDNVIDDPPFSPQEEVKEKKVLNVIVFPRKAGTFFDGSTQEICMVEDHLKNATITPTLVFKFELEGEHGKTITTTTNTKCCFGEDNNKPSYYQNRIKLSLKCEEVQNPPRLTKDEVDKLEPIKKTVVITSNTSDSLLDGGSTTLGLTILGNQLGGNLTHTHTVGIGLSHTHSIETIVDQLDGFEVSRESQESKMIYRFNYPRQSLDHAIYQFNDTGFPKICNTFDPKIIGEWHVSETDVNKCAKYKFEVERRFFSIEDLIQSRKDGTSNLRSIPQRYDVCLEVNHAMSHIHNYQTSERLDGVGTQDLPNVIKAHPAN